MLVAISGSVEDIITENHTVGPMGLHVFQDNETFSVNKTWTPTPSQENVPHLFCYTAINSGGLSSSHVCIEFLPGLTVPSYPHSRVSNKFIHLAQHGALNLTEL